MLRVDPVGALTSLRLEGLDLVAGLLHSAGHEAADGVLLPAHLVHDLGQRRAVLPLEQGDYLRGLPQELRFVIGQQLLVADSEGEPRRRRPGGLLQAAQ